MDLYQPQFWEPNQKPEPGFDEINWDHPLTNGLIAEWVLNEGGGRQITNLVNGVQSNSGLNVLPWMGSYYGSALQMRNANGGNNFLSISSPPQFTGTLPFSFVALTTSTTTATVMSSVVDTSNFWRASVNANTNVTNFFRTVGGVSVNTFAFPPGANAGPMTVMVGTYNGATMTISSNGSARATAASSTSMPSTASTFRFGHDGTNAGINGPLALVRLYNRTLTITEEQETVRNPFAFYAPTLSHSHGVLATTYANSPLRSRILQSRTIRGAA